MPKYAPWIVLSFVTLMSGAIFAMIKYMGQYVSPVELLLIRFLPTSLLSIILILIFYRRSFLGTFLKTWWYFIPRELVAIFGYHLILIYCETVLTAGVTALIVGTWPVMTIILASPTLREKITRWKITGAILAFIGVAAVVLTGAGHEAGKLAIPALVWVKFSVLLLIAPLSAAIVTIVTRWYLSIRKEEEHPDSLQMSLICRLLAGFYVMTVYAFRHDPSSIVDKLAVVPVAFWILAAVISFHHSLFGFWLLNWCIQKLPAANVALFSYLQTAFALVIATLFLGEEITFMKIFGAVLIVAGVILANFETWKQDRMADVSEQGRIG
ncbi:MAG: DMT family transporter [bacterium]|nr:DMT family transporter [bacterium]